jgi:hypothetical protein
MSQSDYLFFIAHAGADTEAAKKLRNLLAPTIRVFLDAYDLKPGDLWDVELPRHQKRSLATVALLSRNTELAYYLREEIATAIAMERDDPAGHRLIPVYLDGVPSDPKEIPYGVRVKHSLDAARLGMEGIAEELLKAAEPISQKALPPTPAEPPETVDRFVLYDAMCRLNTSMFEELLFRTAAPTAHMAPDTMPLARRALDLIQWAESQSPAKLKVLNQAVRRMAPGAFAQGS